MDTMMFNNVEWQFICFLVLLLYTPYSTLLEISLVCGREVRSYVHSSAMWKTKTNSYISIKDIAL